jgi:hypothetical protein
MNWKIVIGILTIGVIILGGAVFLSLRGSEDTWLCQNGTWVKHGNPSAPMPQEACGKIAPENNTPAENILPAQNNNSEANIVVDLPKANDEITNPLILKGKARVFENQFNFRLKDKKGKILTEGTLLANSSEAGQFGNFEKTINFPDLQEDAGVLEVFDYSAKDGSEIDKVIISVKFKSTIQVGLKVFFGNSKKDPETLHCEKVYPVIRKVAKTQAPARAALEELLSGVASQEKDDGYFSNINPGVKIQALSIENGTAKVDFNEALQKNVGGSCKVTMIRAQITETLKQFPTVKKVIISIDGKAETILQP